MNDGTNYNPQNAATVALISPLQIEKYTANQKNKTNGDISNGERPVQVLDCLLLIKVIKRGKIPRGHVGLLAAAQLSLCPPGAAHRWNGDRELAHGHDLLGLGTGLRVCLVGLDSAMIRVVLLLTYFKLFDNVSV